VSYLDQVHSQAVIDQRKALVDQKPLPLSPKLSSPWPAWRFLVPWFLVSVVKR
jgi:hypothetical protein